MISLTRTSVISRSDSINFEELDKWLLQQQTDHVQEEEMNDPFNFTDCDYGISPDEVDSWFKSPGEDDCNTNTGLSLEAKPEEELNGADVISSDVISSPMMMSNKHNTTLSPSDNHCGNVELITTEPSASTRSANVISSPVISFPSDDCNNGRVVSSTLTELDQHPITEALPEEELEIMNSFPPTTNNETLSLSVYDYGISFEEIDSWENYPNEENECYISTSAETLVSLSNITEPSAPEPSVSTALQPIEFQGEMGCPCGFRFNPTDQELLLCYLAGRLSGRMLPSDAVRDCDVYAMEPWLLPGAENIKKSLYFFVHPKKLSEKCSRPDRGAGNGFWRMSTSKVNIWDNNKRIIGYQRQLVYKMFTDYNRNYKTAKNTNWIMYEYKLREHEELTICKVKNNGRSVGV